MRWCRANARQKNELELFVLLALSRAPHPVFSHLSALLRAPLSLPAAMQTALARTPLCAPRRASRKCAVAPLAATAVPTEVRFLLLFALVCL